MDDYEKIPDELRPLDDRDTTPWEDDGEDQAAYQKEREDEQLDAYFAGSDGNVY